MRPELLREGDIAGVIAPAGPVKKQELERGVRFFEGMGLRVTLGHYVKQNYGYLAGNDDRRLDDLHKMFADPDVKAIFCARGGYGTARLASKLDIECIKQNPKIFWGYSDITYLHTMIRQKAGVVTFHGPMVASDIAKPAFDPLSASMFHQLFSPVKLYYSEAVSPLKIVAPGKATGELVGGNLSLLVSTLGTPQEIETHGKIIVIEDIGEDAYRVDAMLNQLKLAGKLEHPAGIVIGDFASTEPANDRRSFSLKDVFRQYLGALNCPVISGFKIGHCTPHFAIPLGVKATLSTQNKTLVIDPGVR